MCVVCVGSSLELYVDVRFNLVFLNNMLNVLLSVVAGIKKVLVCFFPSDLKSNKVKLS